MTEFMRPQVSVDEIDARTARYVVEPLERGYGYTLGNSMRRVLLSSLQGAAATSIRVEGVQHEFSTIKGVREDVTDIVLNVKGLVFSHTDIGEEEATATLAASGPAAVTGAALRVPSEFELINPDHVIAHLEKGATFDLLKERHGHFRNWDHQLLQEMYVVKVKDKSQSKDKWDIFDIVRAVPGPKESLELIQPTQAENACKMA